MTTYCERKDDYRVLQDWKRTRRDKDIEEHLKDYKLLLNEEKTDILDLPEGLFRPWVTEYQKSGLARPYEL